uniref:LigA n=1 Tax=Parastrongyloides trichosuri TaxID=131310 RepID=A0A0N4ZJF0_PARTI
MDRGRLGMADGLRPARGRRQVGGGRRLRREAQYPARPGLDRGEDHRGPRLDHGGRDSGPQPRRRGSVERSGRSGRDRRIRRARDQEAAGQRQAADGHLPGPPDAGIGAGAKTEKMHQGHHGANHPVKDSPPAR